MERSGLLIKWVRDSWTVDQECNQNTTDVKNMHPQLSQAIATQLNLLGVQGVFYMLGLFMTFAFFVLVAESIFKQIKKS